MNVNNLCFDLLKSFYIFLKLFFAGVKFSFVPNSLHARPVVYTKITLEALCQSIIRSGIIQNIVLSSQLKIGHTLVLYKL